MSEVFLDTSFAVALSARSDQHHVRAVELSRELRSKSTRMVTSRAVALEIGNALAKHRYRAAAVALLAALDSDPLVEIVPVTEELYHKGFELFCARQDKEWGLIDCVSFVVMQERHINDALTADEHFHQAGFRALLKET